MKNSVAEENILVQGLGVAIRIFFNTDILYFVTKSTVT